jgi:hypothetical protein
MTCSDEGFPTIPRAQPRRDHDIFRDLFSTQLPHITYTMAPKRSNQPGAISQMYTSLASPDNRSVVTAVTFFVVSSPSATITPAYNKGSSMT